MTSSQLLDKSNLWFTKNYHYEIRQNSDILNYEIIWKSISVTYLKNHAFVNTKLWKQLLWDKVKIKIKKSNDQKCHNEMEKSTLWPTKS